MKRIILFLLFTCCVPVVVADYDRLIGPGEYEYFLEWPSGVLVVNGGGAEWIEVRNSAHVEIWSTSPLGYNSGIWDIVLTKTSRLDYYGGETQELTIGQNAVAYLHSGRIDYITSMQFTSTTGAGPHIDLYAQPGWSWLDDDWMKGIEGKWMDGSSFTIKFINHPNFDPVYTNINVIIPEPATLMLLGLGGLLIRRKK